MSQLTTIPREDVFSAILTQELGSGDMTANVSATPNFILGVGETFYVTLSAGNSLMEAIKCDGYDSGAKTLSIVTRNVPLGDGYSGGAKTHPVTATVIISDNYANWKAIQTAINSKFDTTGGTITGATTIEGELTFADVTAAGLNAQSLTTAQRDALTPSAGMIVYNSDVPEVQMYEDGGWISITSQAEFDAHLADLANPHAVTKTQVGLGNVDDYATASAADGASGTASDKFMTPFATAAAITTLAVDRLGFETVTSTTYTGGLMTQVVGDGITYDITYESKRPVTVSDGSNTWTISYSAGNLTSIVKT